MSNVTLQLDGDALKQATIQAINGTLTPEVKDKLILEAIDRILRPSTNNWEKGQSEIERLFQQSVIDVARLEAKRMVEEDKELRLKITDLLSLTAKKVLDTDVDKLAERMADALVSSLRDR